MGPFYDQGKYATDNQQDRSSVQNRERETDRQVGGDSWRLKSRGGTVVKVVSLTVGYKVIFYCLVSLDKNWFLLCGKHNCSASAPHYTVN